ncbi:MAG TPA: heme-copper oxidase subunit III [Actinomycetota bacterium]|nr:heme-copper oxidase subunit III [Actinomycetota bacterium]
MSATTARMTRARRRPVPPEEALPVHAGGPRSYGWWGMVWLIATEATLFAALIATYFFLRFRTSGDWPPGDIAAPELTLPLVMSAILLSSSIPVHIADAGIKRGDQRRLRWGLAAGFVLGATFLAITLGIEWPDELKEFTPRTNVYGSLYFTITGFHAAHVIVGLLLSAWTQVRAWHGAFDAERHVTVQNFAMYWHFVDVVWVAVFSTIYLSPNL